MQKSPKFQQLNIRLDVSDFLKTQKMQKVNYRWNDFFFNHGLWESWSWELFPEAGISKRALEYEEVAETLFCLNLRKYLMHSLNQFVKGWGRCEVCRRRASVMQGKPGSVTTPQSPGLCLCWLALWWRPVLWANTDFPLPVSLGLCPEHKCIK